jgi:hypothetical protein
LVGGEVFVSYDFDFVVDRSLEECKQRLQRGIPIPSRAFEKPTQYFKFEVSERADYQFILKLVFLIYATTYNGYLLDLGAGKTQVYGDIQRDPLTNFWITFPILMGGCGLYSAFSTRDWAAVICISIVIPGIIWTIQLRLQESRVRLIESLEAALQG